MYASASSINTYRTEQQKKKNNKQGLGTQNKNKGSAAVGGWTNEERKDYIRKILF